MSHRIPKEEGTWEEGNVSGVLSKELLTFEEGTAKLIRLRPGAAYPRHQHPQRTEYAYVLEGHPTLTVDHEAYETNPGDFVAFPTDTPHALANPGDRDALLLVGAVYHHRS